MEMSVLVEENNQRRSSAPVSKPLGSIVRIDAISIELAGVMQNNYEANKCEHFSIRGYAAEMRRKDMSVCFPFPFNGNSNKLEEQTNMLPPLHVAKFRWWGCKNCVREMGAEETGITCVHYQSDVLSRCTCPHILPSATAMVLSDSHISPDLDTLSGRKTNGGNSTTKDEIRLSSCIYNKGKKHEVGLATVLGRGNVKRDDENPVHDLISNPGFIQDRHADGPNAPVSKIHDFVEFCEPSFRTHTSADLETPENSSGIHQMGTLDSSDCQQRMASISLPGINFFKGKTGKRPALDLEENDILAEICHGDKHMGRPSSSIPQRTQKVRLLTELLGSKRNFENDQIRTEVCPSSRLPNVSSGLETVSALRGHMAVQASMRRHFEDPNGKRKISLDKEGGKMAKNVRVFKDVKIMQKINHVKIGDRGKYSAPCDVTLSKSAHNTSMPKSEMKTHFRSSLSPQQSEGKTIMSKKKIKHVGSGKNSIVPKRPSALGESSIMKKCLGIKETEPNVGKGLDLSLKSYAVAHRNERGGIPTSGDGIDLLLPPRKGAVREDTQHNNAIMHIGESSVSHKPASDQIFRKGLLCDLNENITANRTSPSCEIQTHVPRVENGSFSRHQHLDFSSTRGTEEVQEQGNDDIPMEIVEILARNQYERYCQETERNLFFLKQAKDKRDAELNGFSRVHGNGMVKSLQENKCRVTSPVTTDENVGIMKQNQSNCFSDSYGNHLSFGNPEGNSAFTGFSAFSKYKEKQTGGVQICDIGATRYSRPQNSQWNGMRQSEEAGRNHMAFDYIIPQMHASQSREGRRMIGDHDLNFMKPNANDPFIDKRKGFDLNEKVPGSLDLNSNETIPAMQLLSLMDAGVQSTSAFSLDGNPKFFGKPFFPSPNHLKVLHKPQFSYDHQKRGIGSYNDISRNGKNIQQKYFECPPAVPAVGAFLSPFQNEERVVGFPKRGKSLVQSRGRKSQKPATTSGVLRTNHQSNPVQNKEREMIRVNCMGGTVFSMGSISNNEICTLNRNPADFSIPEAGNVYMSSVKDLKFGKTGYFNGGSDLNNRDGRKRQRVTKLN